MSNLTFNRKFNQKKSIILMKLFRLIFLLRFRQVFEQILSLEEGMMRAS